jgi:hypothetical protein
VCVEFFSRLALPVEKKCIVSIRLHYSVFLKCKMLWTQELLIPCGKTALRGGAAGRVCDPVSAVLAALLPRTLAEIKSTVVPILTARASYSEARI